MKIIKFKHHSNVTDDHLTELLKIALIPNNLEFKNLQKN